MLLRDGDHVLFFGDSITDCGRTGAADPDEAMGSGYAFLCAAMLSARHPGSNLRFTNRGIGGNRVSDLEGRLGRDVLDLRPDVLSVLIGINDTWRRYDSDVVSPVDAFARSYERILSAAREQLGARLIVMEPFLLPVPEDRRRWREDLDPRIAAVRELARRFEAVYVPLDGLFAAAACRRPMDYWLPDGVHPTPAGHALIADAWLRAVGA